MDVEEDARGSDDDGKAKQSNRVMRFDLNHHHCSHAYIALPAAARSFLVYIVVFDAFGSTTLRIE
jgi:hypothetical protein